MPAALLAPGRSHRHCRFIYRAAASVPSRSHGLRACSGLCRAWIYCNADLGPETALFAGRSVVHSAAAARAAASTVSTVVVVFAASTASFISVWSFVRPPEPPADEGL